MHKPKPCIICSTVFQPKTSKSKLCGKKECKKELDLRRYEKKAQEKFKHGVVFVSRMDVPMEDWEWVEEVR